jgi:hypothetical protein
VSIVRGTTTGPYLDANGDVAEGPHQGIIMSPRQVDAKDGDTISFCNKTNVQSSLFSGARYNTFGGGLTGAPGSGVRLIVGACARVTMHNPTSQPITVVVSSELGVPKLFVTVAQAPFTNSTPYTLTGPSAETSAWPTPAAGFTWSGGAGSVHVTYQTAQKPNTATISWKLPSGISADGSKGSLTLTATAGSEVWAPGFQINGVLVGCSGITNTPSYGTGCADGDHAAIGVSLAAGESKTVTQEFLIKPGVGTATVVVPGFSQQFVYTSVASKHA